MHDGGEIQLPGGKDHGVPPQHVIGAHEERLTAHAALDEDEPGDGAEVGPTAQAEERERERHRLERKQGRMAAGSGDNLRDRREPGVSRESLDAAARAADEKVKRR